MKSLELFAPAPAAPPPPPASSRRPVRFPIPPSAPTRACLSCGAPIVWTVTTGGRRMPLDADGTSHFATCPHAAEHRRSR